MKYIIMLILTVAALTSAQSYGRTKNPNTGPRTTCPPPIACLVNPCDVMTCPNYPSAVCYNDDPCDRACVGNFYLHGRRLNDLMCHM